MVSPRSNPSEYEEFSTPRTPRLSTKSIHSGHSAPRNSAKSTVPVITSEAEANSHGHHVTTSYPHLDSHFRSRFSFFVKFVGHVSFSSISDVTEDDEKFKEDKTKQLKDSASKPQQRPFANMEEQKPNLPWLIYLLFLFYSRMGVTKTPNGFCRNDNFTIAIFDENQFFSIIFVQ